MNKRGVNTETCLYITSGVHQEMLPWLPIPLIKAESTHKGMSISFFSGMAG